MPNELRIASGVGDLYRECMAALNDAEYCSGVVDALIYTLSRRLYSYVSEDGGKPVKHLVLSPKVDYVVGTYVDRNKETVVFALRAKNHTAYLVYKKNSDGRFVLRSALAHTVQNEAMLNGPNIPQDFEL